MRVCMCVRVCACVLCACVCARACAFTRVFMDVRFHARKDEKACLDFALFLGLDLWPSALLVWMDFVDHFYASISVFLLSLGGLSDLVSNAQSQHALCLQFDLPAMLTYVREKTGVQKVNYVGHSQVGCI